MKRTYVRFGLANLVLGTSIFITAPALSQPVTLTRDKLHSYAGVLHGATVFTPSADSRTGQAGDHSIDFGTTGAGTYIHVTNATFLNIASSNDVMTFSLWIKKYDIVASSAFWANSPSSSTGQRGYQAHVPWEDDNLYFDTAGCCDGSAQRISASITGFPPYAAVGDDSWWTNWHHFVFIKNGATDKEIWIDGQSFLVASSSAPLPTDFTDLYVGSSGDGNGSIHALIDDFAVFTNALGAADIGRLASGTLPDALGAGTGLLAYWDFNDAPAPPYILSVAPTPGTWSAAPNLVQVKIQDGGNALDTSTVTLQVDGSTVTPSIVKPNATTTVTYVPSPIFAALSMHSATISFHDGANTISQSWSFIVGPITLDRVHGYPGILLGPSVFSDDGKGHTGTAGDRSIDFGKQTGTGVRVPNASFLNIASSNDVMTFSLWVKRYDINESSAFWANSPSTTSSQRGFQAHVPWDNDNIYFDTSGCCDGTSQRISDTITTFPPYAAVGNDSWWTNWHHLVFIKNGPGDKEIWIDGQSFLTASSTAPLPTDFTDLYLGAGGDGSGSMHGAIDDFAVFTNALSSADIGRLATGTAPDALGAGAGLLAFWDFNTAPTSPYVLSVTPTPEATAAHPIAVSAIVQDGVHALVPSTLTLQLDGTALNTAVASRVGAQTTITYQPNPLLAPLSAHTARVSFADGPNQINRTWSFTVEPYTLTLDRVQNYLGLLRGGAVLSPNGAGHTGTAADRAVDFGTSGTTANVWMPQAGDFLNPAAASDTLTFSFWMKRYGVENSSAFWVNSRSLSAINAGQAAFQTHLPWSDDNIYFDSAGCCDATMQRISQSITTFAPYTAVGNDGWWTNWHHFVFIKNGVGDKEIWIDGQSFLVGSSTSPLPADLTDMYLGAGVDGTVNSLHALIDDFAAYATPLGATDIGRLFSGTAPDALGAATSLVAYWSFDALAPPALSISRTGGVITVTYSGTLEFSATVNGTYAPVSGASNPFTPTAPGFYRARN